MKKLIILSSLLVFLSLFLKVEAQDIRWGDANKKQSRSLIKELIAKDKNGIYAYRLQYFGQTLQIPILEHFDNNFDVKYSNALSFFADKDTNFRDFIYFNIRLYVAYSVYDRKADRHNFLLDEINKASGELLQKPIEIGATYTKARTIRGALVHSISPDSSKIAFAVRKDIPANGLSYFSARYRPDISNRFQLTVLDKSLNSLWSKELFLSYDEKLFEAISVKVDKNGDAYLLCKIYKDRIKNIRRGDVNYNYKLIAFREEGNTQQEYDINLGDDFINELDFRIGKDGTIVCAGLYSDKGGKSVQGPFFIKIDRTSKEIVAQGKKEFDTDFLQLFMSERRAKKGKQLYSYTVDEIILRSDGGALIITEQYYVSERTVTTTDAFGRTQREVEYYYNFNDIIVININPDASVAWSSKIPKRQISSTPIYSSYAHAVVKDRIYFLFNDYIGRRSTVMLASINTEGKVDFKELFNNKEADTVTRPMVCKQTAKNTMIIYGEKRKTFRFGAIKFD